MHVHSQLKSIEIKEHTKAQIHCDITPANVNDWYAATLKIQYIFHQIYLSVILDKGVDIYAGIYKTYSVEYYRCKYDNRENA
jgi:hypothetical protein